MKIFILVFTFWYFKVSLYSEKIYISEGSFILLSDIFQALVLFHWLLSSGACIFSYRCLYSACLRTRVKRLLWASRWVFKSSPILIARKYSWPWPSWPSWCSCWLNKLNFNFTNYIFRWSLLSLCSCLLNKLNWNLKRKN